MHIQTTQPSLLSREMLQRLQGLQQAEARSRQSPRFLPRSFTLGVGDIRRVDTFEGIQELVDTARQLSLFCIGIDFEFRYAGEPVRIRNGRTWYDPRSVEPLLLGVALLEQTACGGIRLHRFAVDCRNRDNLSGLTDLFRLPVCFVAHYARAEFHCLWQLGLPIPDRIWDTWVAERAFILGRMHSRYQPAATQGEELERQEEIKQQIALQCDLLSVCRRRELPYAFGEEKQRLQRSFLDHPSDGVFTSEQQAYCLADAEAAASLYEKQIQQALYTGVLDHLIKIEMPWTVTLARMVWDGVLLSQDRCRKVLDACETHQHTLHGRLNRLGLGNPNSHPQLEEYFRRKGILGHFLQRKSGSYTFDDEVLKDVEDLDPAVPLIRVARKVQRLLNETSLTGRLIGSDGRIHPDHKQLGAETGRNSMSDPNIGGIGKALRPVVVATEGYLLAEVDLCQIEVGIAAAVYDDKDLVAMFNGRDVYSAMARKFYSAELPATAANLSDKEFKTRYRDKRDRMKVFTLATIYNITPHSLAGKLRITKSAAEAEQQRFLGMFPALKQHLSDVSQYGALRGYATTFTGLRRYRKGPGRPTTWEINWLRNFPVQGSACAVFKDAGNRLYRRYQSYGARLLLPMHDAYVFEAPKEVFAEVVQLTAEVMRSTVQEHFPMLRPQVDINDHCPECWNKDGDVESLQRWCENPCG